MTNSQQALLSRTLGVFLIVLGTVLCLGGVWLASLGGSLYYILIGIAFIASGIFAFLRNAIALWIYAAVVAANLVWALWEVGLDWWQLAPRGGLIVLIGIILVLPPVVRSIYLRHFRNSAWAALVATLLVSVGIATLAATVPTHNMAGTLPGPTIAAETIATAGVPLGEWHAYGRTPHGRRYSPLDQITPGNVKSLQVAWQYHTGDVRGPEDPGETTYEVTPLMVGDTVYLCTPHQLVIALDAETGAENWRFDPKLKEPQASDTQHLTCRGVSYHDGKTQPGTATPDCIQRLFLPTVDARIIALSAKTGAICPGFGGEDGAIDLWQNMPNVLAGSYYSTSPPVITRNLIVVGGAVNDNVSTTEPSGVIRAFDINTGALVWNWDSGNPGSTAPLPPGETYTANSPNSWSVSSYDPELDLIYAPMGNSPPDQFGGARSKNAEIYSAAVVALRAATGQVAWVFQTVHHDLWDMDVPAQPSLIDLNIGGTRVPSLVVPTKQGDIYVLDRRTGQPILPVTEEPAPQGAVDGDFVSATQPTSALSFNPAPLTEAAMWGITPFDQLYCRIKFRSLRYEGRYTPPSTQGTIVYPGNFGTFNWGAIAVDPERQVAFAMPVYLAFTVKLIPRSNDTERLISKEGEPAFNENFGSPYAAKISPFLSPLGLPCQAPPWGYVAGADLTTGKIAYQHVNGTVRDLAPIPLPLKMGVPGIGGPIVTKGGVAFLSGTLDYFVRGYDVTTGEKLWEDRLPAGGQATPMSYWSEKSQRQFVIVVAGGHGSTGTKAGDSIIAYALPK